MDLAYLLNPEILSPNPISTVCDQPIVTQDDEIISISDYDDEISGAVTMTGNDKELQNTNLIVFEFEFTYGLTLDRIACASITFDKSDIETELSTKAWVILCIKFFLNFA